MKASGQCSSRRFTREEVGPILRHGPIIASDGLDRNARSPTLSRTSWNIRWGGMDHTRRKELDLLGQIVKEMRYRAQRDIDGNPDFGVWSITLIPDLRTRSEREPETRKGNAG